MPAGPAGKNPIADHSYDASVVRSETRMPPGVDNFLEPAPRVATLRPKHGYSATNYDASPAKHPESSRRQFWEKYDVKKVRNT